jgi:uncharacterized protein (TIGR03083 family)
MPDTAQAIAALHAGADQLDPLVRELNLEQLVTRSGAGDWDASEVLSHLGIGADIWLAALDAAVSGQPDRGSDADQGVWARWKAMEPAERAPAYLAANAAMLARYDSIAPTVLDTLRVDLGVLPHPVDVATTALFRLNEFTLHSWDVRVALDPTATLHPDAVPVLLDHVGPLLSRVANPTALAGHDVTLTVTLHAPARTFGLHLTATGCAIGGAPARPGATLAASGEAWLRLVSGRLTPGHTPPSVQVTGSVGLGILRQVFPGY